MSPSLGVRDKRRFHRIAAQHIVSFAPLSRGLLKEPMIGLGRTLDVGAGGARLETNRPLEVGERLALEIAMGSQIIHAEATVVHVTSTESDMVAAGLAFDSIPASDRETLTALGF